MKMTNVPDYTQNHPTNELIGPMITSIHYPPDQLLNSVHLCVICGSKSIGVNFGVLTCAPCKAFFRRNARRRELLELPCRHRDLSALTRNNIEFNERTARYLQIRRCSSCRLRRCFEVGMREELVRTDEENERHRQLVDINRNRREVFQQQLIVFQNLFYDTQLSNENGWRHLSNIVYAYDACCLKTFVQQRAELVFNKTPQPSDKHPTTLTMCIVLAASSFLRSLPAFNSLSRSTRNYLCKTNLRPLIFPNLYELNQSCFSEPWQVAAYASTWQLMCGAQLYEDFLQIERMTEKLWIADPIVSRLWIIVLFFSTPLHYHDDGPTSTPILKKKKPLRQVQNTYVTLLWRYLSHRHGDLEAVRIFSNLVRVYMKMQSVGFGIYTRLRSQQELKPTHETLNKLVTADISEDKQKNSK